MALRPNLTQALLAALLLAATAGGCKKDVKKDKPGPDPDTNSGADAKRGGAKPMLANRSETDSVSWPKLQRTKWKQIELKVPGVQNILDCELHIDNTGMDLNIDIFNSLGTQIGFSPGPAPNKLKKLAVPIEDLGTYFVRIQGAKPTDESDFSVRCNWEEKAAEVAPEPEAPKVRPHHPRPHHEEPKAAEEPKADKIENGLEGRIVQAYREKGNMMLNLDKGAAAGIHPGTRGVVLEGKSGRTPLDGGEFKVTKVIDDTHSVAECQAGRLGRNNRVVFFLK